MNTAYDIFISYRRTGGAQYARILQLMLTQRGYKVFLDYDELTDGIFSDHIKGAILSAPVFMLVLSEGAMERCVNEDDWVRQEILLAIEQKKHLVPVNPDNLFDGFPEQMPDIIKKTIGSHQHSEIAFGQTLGATIDLMIKNRLVPTLGERTPLNQRDESMDTATETLRSMDARSRFVKRLSIGGIVAMVLIVLATCILFWHQQRKQNELTAMRTELEKKYSDFQLYLSPHLTLEQMATIDDLLGKMVEVKPDSLWMSQFECTTGWWNGVLGLPCDEELRHMPKTNVSMGDISMTFLDSLRNMTNIEFDLPSAEEWEEAARGGKEGGEKTLYAGSDDVEAVAWYRGNADGHAHPSDGQQGKEPNGLDLFDMSGNVSELCNTPYTTDTGEMLWTLCGGNYTSAADEVTLTARAGIDADQKEETAGFRIVIRKQ